MGHARVHAAESGHPFVQSFEPGEDWFWSFPDEAYLDGPELAPPIRIRSTSRSPVRPAAFRPTGQPPSLSSVPVPTVGL